LRETFDILSSPFRPDCFRRVEDRQAIKNTAFAEARPSQGYSRWHGDDEARAAVYGNRNRLKSGIGKEAMRKRGEIVERSFAHVLERGGMRRTWLRGRENVHCATSFMSRATISAF
jgi:hypothetical protein